MRSIFLSIVEELPQKYEFIKKQLNADFLISYKPNTLNFKDWYSFLLNSELENEYQNKKVKAYFQIKGIKIFNSRTGKYEDFIMSFSEGILIGFYVENINLDIYDITKTDVSGLFEKHFENKDLEELKRILGDIPLNIADLLDVNDTFKIETPKDSFYVIKDLKDGNYLSVDTQGAVFGMIHDPYEVEKLFDNKEDFYEALNSGKFSISEYCDKKMS
ncbi:hypothetical protein NAT51_19265 [Flavobacterium amniphilum]|uniref:hypothetical protein n=1 Tax=Flavobacterium amniphilum TaxID=1834035 RepID=UPI00202A7F5E|nr:hypothetical protein [Flavobacterium amniphilum]MCL9807671.1 hypothetical protein [Flavobacterium amniphilum]